MVLLSELRVSRIEACLNIHLRQSASNYTTPVESLQLLQTRNLAAKGLNYLPIFLCHVQSIRRLLGLSFHEISVNISVGTIIGFPNVLILVDNKQLTKPLNQTIMKTTSENTSFAEQGLEQLIHLISLPEAIEENAQGVFKGKVISAKTGARVFGVIVELVGTTHTYVTSPTGYFKMTNLPEGIYLAKFSFPGFKEVTEVIAVISGEPLDMTLSLEVVE